MARHSFLHLLLMSLASGFGALLVLGATFPRQAGLIWPLVAALPLLPRAWTFTAGLLSSSNAQLRTYAAWMPLVRLWGAYLLAMFLVSSLAALLLPINALPLLLTDQVASARAQTFAADPTAMYFVTHNLWTLVKSVALSVFGSAGFYTAGLTVTYGGVLSGLAARVELVDSGFLSAVVTWCAFTLSMLVHSAIELFAFMLAGSAATGGVRAAFDGSFGTQTALRCTAAILIACLLIIVAAAIEAFFAPVVLDLLLSSTPVWPDNLYSLALW